MAAWAQLGRFNNLAGLQAGCADADPLIGAVYMRTYGTQIHVPTAAAHVVSVADLISKLRAFAAEIANLCHFNNSQIFLTQKGFRGFRSCS